MDTNQDKGIEKKQATKETEETKATEEAIEPKEGEEEQPVTEEETEGPEEELIETAPKEEAEEAEKVEGVAEEAEKEAEEAAPEVEEEEKKEKRKKEAEEEEIVEERIYTIPLRRVWISPRKKRAPRAVRVVESFIQRHMKVETGTKADEEEEEARLIISNEVNEKLWSRGIEKPPRNIRVRAVKDKEGTVTVYLAEGD